MRRRKQHSSRRQTDGQAHGRLSRQASIWLATLSTVVGVATGMFTLRDEIFPGEAGTAGAISAPAYRLSVGQVCDDVNTAERARVRELRTLDRRVRRATTTLQQRNALLDAVRNELDRSSDALAALTALDPPKGLSVGQRSTTAAWNRNLRRIETYAQQLDGASDRRAVMASIDTLSRRRPVIARDGLRVTSGLRRLGEAHCRLDPPRPTRTLTLPPVGAKASSAKRPSPPTTGAPAPQARTRRRAPDARPGSAAAGGRAGQPPADEPSTQGPSDPSRPDEPIGPRINTPSLARRLYSNSPGSARRPDPRRPPKLAE